jgi:hypothetical protein
MGDVIDFPEAPPAAFPDALKPFSRAAMEEHSSSLELLAADGRLAQRVRVITGDVGDWVCVLPTNTVLRGRVLAALRAFTAWHLARALVITIATDGAFETWTLAGGAYRGGRQEYALAPHFCITAPAEHLGPEHAPLIVASFSSCFRSTSSQFNGVEAGLMEDTFGPGGLWGLTQIKLPTSPNLEVSIC